MITAQILAWGVSSEKGGSKGREPDARLGCTGSLESVWVRRILGRSGLSGWDSDEEWSCTVTGVSATIWRLEKASVRWLTLVVIVN